MSVRRAGAPDAGVLEAMRIALYGAGAAGEPHEDVAFLWDAPDHGPIAFLELGLHPWAEGCESAPVPYVEGWYVEPPWRGRGIGRALMQAAEDWSRAGGYTDIASDAVLDNTASLAAHRALGFRAVQRVQFFAKRLDGGGPA